jgi:hypothetical protein
MKKLIIKYGIITGAIIGGALAIGVSTMDIENPNFEISAYIGYGSMLLAFALLIPAVRQANALEYLGFWKNVLFCLGIVAIAAAIYSLVWTIYITFINPGAIETFTKYYTDEIAEAPLTGDNLKEAMENVAFMKNIYSTPAFCFLFTLIEPLPVGILLSFLSSTLAHYKNNKLTKAPH